MAVDTTKDNFETRESPAKGGAAITPHDTNELATHSRSLYIGDISGGAGLKVTFINDDVVTFAGLLAGVTYPFQVKIVWSTGTTATSIVALY